MTHEIDFSTPEGKALFEREVQRRMAAPFFMKRIQAEMLVAALLSHDGEQGDGGKDGG